MAINQNRAKLENVQGDFPVTRVVDTKGHDSTVSTKSDVLKFDSKRNG